MTTEIFAHRGLHITEVENSIPAFLEAKALGVHGVELDVRRTKDREHCRRRTSRVTGRSGDLG